jgi:hypothetical protein
MLTIFDVEDFRKIVRRRPAKSRWLLDEINAARRRRA